MKLFQSILFLTLIIFIGCNQKSKKLPFDKSINKDQTLIKGRVNKWHTDTVYMATLPFHSPFSTFEDCIILNSDKTFEFTFNNIDKPFILCLTPEKKFLITEVFYCMNLLQMNTMKGTVKIFLPCP